MLSIQSRRVVLRCCGLTLFALSFAVGYRADDWSRFDHQTVRVEAVVGGDSLQVVTKRDHRDSLKLLGVDAADGAAAWLTEHAVGRDVTLLLQSPQTRDSSGALRAFVFLGDDNLNVELVKAGLAYADRREKTAMDELLNPAESEARKKKRGLWAHVTFDQMPPWRQAWIKSRDAGFTGRD